MVLGQPVHHEVRVVAKVYFQFYFSTKSVALACRTLPLIRFVTPCAGEGTLNQYSLHCCCSYVTDYGAPEPSI